MSMSVFRRMLLWMRANARRGRYEREMRDEMSAHLERSTALLVARGLSQEDAVKQARREFGDVAYHETEGRDARGTLWLDALAADMRFALRHFARRPLTTLVMFVILSVGMTISSMLFSFVHSFAFQAPPAVTLSDDLVRIRGFDGKPGDVGPRALEPDEFEAIRRLPHFQSVAAWIDADAAFIGPNNPERRAVTSRVNFVTPNYFDVLGLRMAAGPGLPREEPGSPQNVVVIGYQTWKEMFGQRHDAIGSEISLNGVAVKVVGVAPEHFTGVYGQTRLQVWMPMSAKPVIAPRAPEQYLSFGRLRPGVTAAAASAAVGTISKRAGERTAERRAIVFSSDVEKMLSANIDPQFNYIIRLQFVLVGGLALLILLVTCTNVSALLTGLATARRQEIAIRLSLGAARGRIIRQLLTESATLALFAGVAALIGVALIMKLILTLLPATPITLSIGWSVTAFTFGVAIITGVAYGLSPALHATRMALASVLRDSSRGGGAARAHLQKTLVIAQIAFTQPLVVALAGFLVLVLSTLQPRVITDSADRVATLSVQPTTSVAATDAEQRAIMSHLLLRLRGTPGIENVVMSYGQSGWPGDYVAAGDNGASRGTVALSTKPVAEDYFEVLGVPLKRGRKFVPMDVVTANTPRATVPVIIGTDLARKLWGNADPVGRRLETTLDTATTMRTLEVVGVVDDPMARNRPASEAYSVYAPADTSRVPSSMIIRTTGEAAPLLPRIRDAVSAEAPGAVAEVNTVASAEAQTRRNLRLVYGGISFAAGIALTLAAIGLYAVVAFSVAQRTHEIAVRLSVGARGGQIARAFVGDGLRLSLIGMAIGLPLSLAALKLALNPLMVVPVPVPPVAVIAAIAVILVAAAAAWIPARRAAAVDPANVLRGG